MLKTTRGKHRKPRARNVGPLFAFGAALAQLHALREGHSAARRQAGQVTT